MKLKVLIPMLVIVLAIGLYTLNHKDYSSKEKIVEDFVNDLIVYPLTNLYEAPSREEIFKDYFRSSDNIFYRRGYHLFHYNRNDRRPEAFSSELINYDVNFHDYDDVIVAYVTIDYVINYVDNVSLEDNCYAIISLEKVDNRYYIKNIELRY
jgi:hypothetical protein